MATLKGIVGETKGLVFELTKDETTIGRHGANMLVISDPSISAFHCSIIKDGRKFTLRDLDSTNGTKVNGQLLKVHRLAPGNIVQVGNIELLFEGEDVERDADAKPVQSQIPAARVSNATFSLPSNTGFKINKNYSTKLIWIIVGPVALLAALGVIWFLHNLLRLK